MQRKQAVTNLKNPSSLRKVLTSKSSTNDRKASSMTKGKKSTNGTVSFIAKKVDISPQPMSSIKGMDIIPPMTLRPVIPLGVIPNKK